MILFPLGPTVPYRSHMGGEHKNGCFLRPLALCSYCSYLIYIYILLLHHRARSAKAQKVCRSRWERGNNSRKPAENRQFCRSKPSLNRGNADQVGNGS